MRETPVAAAAFLAYAALGPDRSLKKLAASDQKWHKSRSLLGKWSAAHDWQNRVIVHDAEVAKEEERARREAIRKMDDEHATIGHAFLIRTVRRLQELYEAQEIPVALLIALFEKSYKLERIARGAATARLEASGPDGGPMAITGTVGFYHPVMLPEKDPRPEDMLNGHSQE